jgi:ribonuclease P protein component
VPLESNNYIQIAFSATPKNKLNAVQRNTAKRRLRNIYRINKNELIQHCICNNTALAMMLIYQNHEVENYTLLEKKYLKLTQKLIKYLIENK